MSDLDVIRALIVHLKKENTLKLHKRFHTKVFDNADNVPTGVRVDRSDRHNNATRVLIFVDRATVCRSTTVGRRGRRGCGLGAAVATGRIAISRGRGCLGSTVAGLRTISAILRSNGRSLVVNSGGRGGDVSRCHLDRCIKVADALRIQNYEQSDKIM